MENTKIDFKKIQAIYFLKYGYKFDETALSMLLILEMAQKKMFTEQNLKLDTAIEKIKTSQKTLELDTKNPKWQAFAYGLGNMGLALLLAVIFSATSYIMYAIRQAEQQTMPAQLQWYEDFYRANISGKETKAIKAYLRNNPMLK